ncbi:unnamed protein product [Lota lota]
MITSAARQRGKQGLELDEANPAFRIPRRGRPPHIRPSKVIKARPITPRPKCKTGRATHPQKDQVLNFSPDKSSLSRRVRTLWWMVESSAEGILDMNKAAQFLGIHMRHIYDITNVLQGAGILVQTSKYTLQWMGPDLKTKLAREVQILEDQEKKLDELIKTALEQVNHMCEDEISEKYPFLVQSYVKTIPSLMEQTVIVVKAPAETVLEVPHPAESLKLFLKSSQGPIDVYLCSEDHSPFDVPDDSHDDDDHTDCSNDDSVMEPPQTPSFLSMSSTDAADDLCSSTVTMEHLPPLATQSVSPSPSPLTSLPAPSHSSFSSEGEETPSFATLTTPLALSLGGEEYFLSLGEDDGISDLFSSVELEGGLWKCLAPDNLPP